MKGPNNENRRPVLLDAGGMFAHKRNFKRHVLKTHDQLQALPRGRLRETSEMNLAELLAPFKAAELPESAVVLLEDRDAQKLAAFWPNGCFTWNAPRSEKPENKNELWNWIWHGMHINPTSLAVDCGVASNAIHQKLNVLQANRLIYPDHTISKWAQKILQAEVALRYDQRRKQ